MGNWNLLNGVVSLAGVFALLAVMLHPSIHEGLLAKVGMAMMCMSLFLSAGLSLLEAGTPEAHWSAGLLLRLGLAIAGLGVLIRFRYGCRPGKRRRITDLIGGRHVR